MRPEDPLVVVSVYPRLLGTYGDSGNATILAERARRRGVDVRVLVVEPFEPVPRSGDVYLVGGAEDAAQAAAAAEMRRHGGLAGAVTDGAAVFAACAGFQLLGTSFPGEEGREVAGLGLLDAAAHRLERRAVGELLVRPAGGALPALTGYENHASGTALGPGASPLGTVEVGVGNGSGLEGARQGRVVATYLHGPAFARNPALADLVLSLVLSEALGPLEPLEDRLADRLRAERIRAARRGTQEPASAVGELWQTVSRRVRRPAGRVRGKVPDDGPADDTRP